MRSFKISVIDQNDQMDCEVLRIEGLYSGITIEQIATLIQNRVLYGPEGSLRDMDGVSGLSLVSKATLI